MSELHWLRVQLETDGLHLHRIATEKRGLHGPTKYAWKTIDGPPRVDGNGRLHGNARRLCGTLRCFHLKLKNLKPVT